jgi:hypothetical protein
MLPNALSVPSQQFGLLTATKGLRAFFGGSTCHPAFTSQSTLVLQDFKLSNCATTDSLGIRLAKSSAVV